MGAVITVASMTVQKVRNTLYSPSTAIASFLLFSCCLYGIWSMFWANWANLNKVFLHGYLWFGICGAAAALGAVRFGAKTLPQTITKAHRLASWLVCTVGLANLGAQYFIHQYK